MPKYYPFKICGYYLYYTSACIVEAFHVHASDKKLSESGSAKFFVHEDGSCEVQKRGRLNEREISTIEEFIFQHKDEMYKIWLSGQGKPEFYGKNN